MRVRLGELGRHPGVEGHGLCLSTGGLRSTPRAPKAPGAGTFYPGSRCCFGFCLFEGCRKDRGGTRHQPVPQFRRVILSAAVVIYRVV